MTALTLQHSSWTLRRAFVRLCLLLLTVLPLVFGLLVGCCALLGKLIIAAFIQGFVLAYHRERP